MSLKIRFVIGLASAACLTLACGTVRADEDDDVTVVEVREEWELVVGEPNILRSAPQVAMVMSPTGNGEGTYFSFILNHRIAPEYSPGGLQVVTVDGSTVDRYSDDSNQAELDVTEEVVRWRQRLWVSGGTLHFEVDQGTSSTWGEFGGNGMLRLTAPSSLSNLNTYHPAFSVNESDIGFAENRVQSLTLTRLEWHLSDGRVFFLTAPIDIDGGLDPWK